MCELPERLAGKPMLLAGPVPLRADGFLDEIEDVGGKLDVVRLPGHFGNISGALFGNHPRRDPDDLDKEKPLKNARNDADMPRVPPGRIAHEAAGKGPFPVLLDQSEVVPGDEFAGFGSGRSGFFRIRALGQCEQLADLGPQLVLRVGAVIQVFAFRAEQRAVFAGGMRVGPQKFAQGAKGGTVAGFAPAVRVNERPKVGDLVQKHIAHGVEAMGGGKRAIELDRPGFRIGQAELLDIGQHDVGPRRDPPPDDVRRFLKGPRVLPAKPEDQGP